MKSAMRAIGFSDLKTSESWEELKSDVLLEGSSSFIREYEDGKLIVESYKKYADRVYLLVRSGLTEEDQDGAIYSVDECEPYVEAKHLLDVQDLEIEGISADEFRYHVICQEVGTGIQVIFQLQNLIEYFDCLDDNMLEYRGINIVGIAIEGTIVLPLEVNEKEEQELDQQFKKELYTTDILTLVDGYFVPVPEIETEYAILGLIQELEILQNENTKEKMYWMHLDIMGMPIEIIINMEDLVGKPYVGMRFMGTCKVQGTIEFE